MKYLSEDEKGELEELMERATYRMMHEDDVLFEDDRYINQIREDDEDEEQVNLFGDETEEGKEEEERIQQAFFGGKLDALFTLLYGGVISLEYVAGVLQRPVCDVKEFYDSWHMIVMGGMNSGQ